MPEVVRATCPGCQRALTIPAEWTGKTVRCKHCGNAMQVQPKAAPARAPVAPAPVPAAWQAAPAAVPLAAAPAPTWEPLPDAGLPEYVPPAGPAAMPVAPAPRSSYVSAFDAKDRYSGRGQYKGPGGKGWVKYAVVGGLFLALAGGAGALVLLKPGLFKSSPTEPAGPPANSGGGGTGGGGGGDAGVFPRRMLAISIHSYLYANPLHNGDSGFALDDARRSGTDAAVRRLADRWKVPKDQLYHLTDARLIGEAKEPAPKAEPKKPDPKPVEPKKGAAKEPAKKDKPELDDMVAKKPAPPPEPVRRSGKAPPLRMVVEGAITKFLETSRAQDRIVLLFCGHAMEKKGETYLVPIEGDLDEPDTLIPLKWFHEKLAACPAQEKVVIYDVCRLHPERGIERPHPGPMTEALEKALHEAPDGVTVVTSCSAGENALELDYVKPDLPFDKAGVKGGGLDFYGSFFLGLLHSASIAGSLSPDKKLPLPSDEIPVERLATWMKEKLPEVVKQRFKGDRTQTVKLTVRRKAEAVAYNPAEPVPPRFDFPTPPPSADPKAVMAMVREVQLPPVKSFRDDAPPPSISDILPFSEEGLKPYLAGELKTGDTPNAFQQAVLDAVEEMRRLRGGGSAGDLPEEFGGETSDKAKEALRKVQEVPARVEATLDDIKSKLEDVADQKEKQPKRWQVHYEYVLAQVKLRICYVNQYNLALANVRGGKLPDLKDGQTGYRLTAETSLDKNTPAQYKEMFKEAREALTALAKDHPNTPWALLAKSDKSVAIGLRLSGSNVTAPVR